MQVSMPRRPGACIRRRPLITSKEWSRDHDQIGGTCLPSGDVLGTSRRELRAAAVAELDRLTSSDAASAEGGENEVESRLSAALRGVVPVPDASVSIADDERVAIATVLEAIGHHWSLTEGRPRKLLLSVGRPSAATLRGGFTVIEDPGYRNRQWLQRALGLLRDNEAHLAAVLIEPLVQTTAGVSVAKPCEVALFADAVQGRGIPLVCDESAVGLGRTGTLFACEQCLIGPDLLYLGSNLTSGYLPLGAVAVAPTINRPVPDGVSTAQAIGGLGRKLGCAAALRHLEILTAATILDTVPDRAAEMRRLLGVLEGHCMVEAITQRGLIAGVSVASGEVGAEQLCALLDMQGISVERSGSGVALTPPLTITPYELERLCRAMLGALDELAQPDRTLSVDADTEEA